MKKKITKIGKLLKPMLPNLPTDNLYKFGFVGCIFLLSLLYYIRSNEQSNLLKIRSEYDKDYFNAIELKNEFYSTKDSNTLKKNEINRLINQVNRNQIDIESKVVKFNSQSNFMYGLLVVCFLGALLFLWLWYVKLQKYQDIIIKKESEKNDPSSL